MTVHLHKASYFGIAKDSLSINKKLLHHGRARKSTVVCKESKRNFFIKPPENPVFNMNANLMLSIMLTTFCGAFAAPLEETSGSGELMNITESYTKLNSTNVNSTAKPELPTEEPTAISQSLLTASGFNCSAPNEDTEHDIAGNQLLQDLKNFGKYSFIVQSTSTNYVSRQI